MCFGLANFMSVQKGTGLQITGMQTQHGNGGALESITPYSFFGKVHGEYCRMGILDQLYFHI
ncbi:hypothetical protein KP509_03G031400 [Ceratopteris richardii]|uniref:Uncharacterized protein n=1 Tax=Ceratopteris richardii TaxID=49495 RepID=A0A8T2V696_CERRI|nr:hypothetical protein KP509_03G031400 [Ceratopteris richardii]